MDMTTARERPTNSSRGTKPITPLSHWRTRSRSVPTLWIVVPSFPISIFAGTPDNNSLGKPTAPFGNFEGVRVGDFTVVASIKPDAVRVFLGSLLTHRAPCL